MLLQLGAWQEVDEYLRTSKGIIIPSGSNSALANAKDGERLFKAAVDEVIADYQSFLSAP